MYTASPCRSARLFSGLEPMTSWSQGNSFTAEPELSFYDLESVM
jgi:hypothetical protein